jgi:mRNA-degrading endonuclease toxin of MazEF toxin-antitoxin module
VIEPGEIYVADFDQAGPHPVIVVSREALNRGRYVLVVVCTSARFTIRRTLPNCVLGESALRDAIKAIGYVIESGCEPA